MDYHERSRPWGGVKRHDSRMRHGRLGLHLMEPADAAHSPDWAAGKRGNQPATPLSSPPSTGFGRMFSLRGVGWCARAAIYGKAVLCANRTNTRDTRTERSSARGPMDYDSDSDTDSRDGVDLVSRWVLRGRERGVSNTLRMQDFVVSDAAQRRRRVAAQAPSPRPPWWRC